MNILEAKFVVLKVVPSKLAPLKAMLVPLKQATETNAIELKLVLSNWR
jgi:hypothetical protein